MDDVGYVKRMMSIFSDTLGKLDIYKRSLHCTDLKRVVRRYLDERHWGKDRTKENRWDIQM